MSEIKEKMAQLNRQVQYIQQYLTDLGQLPQPETAQVIKGLVELLEDLAGRLRALEEKS
ncbi:MAG: hypothetical protein AB1814_06140 [Thermodesulfobacteriota bacterium]